MSRAERLLLAQLKAGREWSGDLKVSFYQVLGLSSVHLDMAYRQLQGKLSSVKELAKGRMEDLAGKIKSKKTDIARKTKALSKAVNERSKLPNELADIDARIAKRRGLLARADAKMHDKQLFVLKDMLDKRYAIVAALSTVSSRIRDLRFALHQHKRRLTVLEHKREAAAQQAKDPSLCFGSRKLFRSQFHLEENGFASMAKWSAAWRASRSAQFTLDGNSACESGNQFARLRGRGNGVFDLELRLPKALAHLATAKFKVAGQKIACITFSDLTFNHGRDVIEKALEAGRPVIVKFLRDGKSWKVMVGVDDGLRRADIDFSRGALGVDLNAGHVSAALVDADGNPIEVFNFPCVTYGKTSDQAQDLIRKVAKEIATLAARLGVPVVSEKLDFSSKKKALRTEDGPRYSRMLSSFAYSAFDTALASACHRGGIAHWRVNPAYTSIIGRVKFARRYGLSVHAAASVSIARRAMGYSKRLPRSPDGTVTVPTNGSVHVTLGLPVRKEASAKTPKPGHVWTEWNGLNKEYHKALAARGSSRRKQPRPVWKSVSSSGRSLKQLRPGKTSVAPFGRGGLPLHDPLARAGRSR